MFTGIVEEVGQVRQVIRRPGSWTLVIQANRVLSDLGVGKSIAVNGVCLTVTQVALHEFRVDLAPETLQRTNLGDLRPGDMVNLERSVPLGGRLDGHVVQGHVDSTGVIRSKTLEGDSLWIIVETPRPLLRYIVPKGFIAVDGISLTVVQVFEDAFNFMLIPHTQERVALGRKPVGARVNLEVDVLAKYLEKLVHSGGVYAVCQH